MDSLSNQQDDNQTIKLGCKKDKQLINSIISSSKNSHNQHQDQIQLIQSDKILIEKELEQDNVLLELFPSIEQQIQNNDIIYQEEVLQNQKLSNSNQKDFQGLKHQGDQSVEAISQKNNKDCHLSMKNENEEDKSQQVIIQQNENQPILEQIEDNNLNKEENHEKDDTHKINQLLKQLKKPQLRYFLKQLEDRQFFFSSNENQIYMVCTFDNLKIQNLKNEVYNQIIEVEGNKWIVNYSDAIIIHNDQMVVFLLEKLECTLSDEIEVLKTQNTNFTLDQLLKICLDLIDELYQLKLNEQYFEKIELIQILKSSNGDYKLSNFNQFKQEKQVGQNTKKIISQEMYMKNQNEIADIIINKLHCEDNKCNKYKDMVCKLLKDNELSLNEFNSMHENLIKNLLDVNHHDILKRYLQKLTNIYRTYKYQALINKNNALQLLIFYLNLKKIIEQYFYSLFDESDQSEEKKQIKYDLRKTIYNSAKLQYFKGEYRLSKTNLLSLSKTIKSEDDYLFEPMEFKFKKQLAKVIRLSALCVQQLNYLKHFKEDSEDALDLFKEIKTKLDFDRVYMYWLLYTCFKTLGKKKKREVYLQKFLKRVKEVKAAKTKQECMVLLILGQYYLGNNEMVQSQYQFQKYESLKNLQYFVIDQDTANFYFSYGSFYFQIFIQQINILSKFEQITIEEIQNNRDYYQVLISNTRAIDKSLLYFDKALTARNTAFPNDHHIMVEVYQFKQICQLNSIKDFQDKLIPEIINILNEWKNGSNEYNDGYKHFDQLKKTHIKSIKLFIIDLYKKYKFITNDFPQNLKPLCEQLLKILYMILYNSIVQNQDNKIGSMINKKNQKEEQEKNSNEIDIEMVLQKVSDLEVEDTAEDNLHQNVNVVDHNIQQDGNILLGAVDVQDFTTTESDNKLTINLNWLSNKTDYQIWQNLKIQTDVKKQISQTNSEDDENSQSNKDQNISGDKVQNLFNQKRQNIKFNANFLSEDDRKEISNALTNKKLPQIGIYYCSGGEADIYQDEKLNYIYRVCKAKDEEQYQEFEEEFTHVSLLSEHGLVVKYQDTIFIKSRMIAIFIMEEYSCSLLDEIKIHQYNKGFFTFNDIIKIMFDLFNGLISMRSHNIFHSDIKPANILKNHKGGYDISDFGCSMKQNDNQTDLVDFKGFSKSFCPKDYKDCYYNDIYAVGKVLLVLFQFCNHHKIQELKLLVESRLINVNDRNILCIDLPKLFIEKLNIIDLKDFFNKYLDQIIEKFIFIQQLKNISQNYYNNKLIFSQIDLLKSICSKLIKYHIEKNSYLKENINQFDVLQIVKKCNKVSQYLFYTQQYKPAISIIEFIIENLLMIINEKNSSKDQKEIEVRLVKAERKLGHIYYQLKDYINSIQYQSEVLIKIEKYKLDNSHYHLRFKQFLNISLCYAALGIEDLENEQVESYSNFIQIKSKDSIMNQLKNIGNYYLQRNRFDEAQQIFQELLQGFEKIWQPKEIEKAKVYYLYGKTLFGQLQLKLKKVSNYQEIQQSIQEIQKQFEKSLQLYEEIEQPIKPFIIERLKICLELINKYQQNVNDEKYFREVIKLLQIEEQPLIGKKDLLQSLFCYLNPKNQNEYLLNKQKANEELQLFNEYNHQIETFQISDKVILARQIKFGYEQFKGGDLIFKIKENMKREEIEEYFTQFLENKQQQQYLQFKINMRFDVRNYLKNDRFRNLFYYQYTFLEMMYNQDDEETIKIYFFYIFTLINSLHERRIIHRNMDIENIYRVLFGQYQIRIKDGCYFQLPDTTNQVNFSTTSQKYVDPFLKSKWDQGEYPFYDAFKFDVFSLGIMLFRMLSLGFQSYDLLVLIEQEQLDLFWEETFKRSNVRKNISQELKELIVAMIHPNENKRQSLNEVLKSNWFSQIQFSQSHFEIDSIDHFQEIVFNDQFYKKQNNME